MKDLKLDTLSEVSGGIGIPSFLKPIAACFGWSPTDMAGAVVSSQLNTVVSSQLNDVTSKIPGAANIPSADALSSVPNPVSDVGLSAFTLAK
ncbi:hypothetical protein F0225_02180 [Vibrio pectenicida]|uniref:Bacteriocin n=1 Tax=Vibrio pectenicida TaxID=62763 RepID=A0A7Y3ZX88_9VIBR|nr:hypothetical protein [Vibrio pectenicida]NOH70149.1 hypothetical protein [Vibrio pectenicida]